jgi:hypothetical protein
LTGKSPELPSSSKVEENAVMRDVLVTGMIVGLFALIGGAAGSYLAVSQAMKATDPRSAEVALARLHSDPSMSKHI